jgi:hypothetical protein
MGRKTTRKVIDYLYDVCQESVQSLLEAAVAAVVSFDEWTSKRRHPFVSTNFSLMHPVSQKMDVVHAGVSHMQRGYKGSDIALSVVDKAAVFGVTQDTMVIPTALSDHASAAIAAGSLLTPGDKDGDTCIDHELSLVLGNPLKVRHSECVLEAAPLRVLFRHEDVLANFFQASGPSKKALMEVQEEAGIGAPNRVGFIKVAPTRWGYRWDVNRRLLRLREHLAQLPDSTKQAVTVSQDKRIQRRSKERKRDAILAVAEYEAGVADGSIPAGAAGGARPSDDPNNRAYDHDSDGRTRSSRTPSTSRHRSSRTRGSSTSSWSRFACSSGPSSRRRSRRPAPPS